MSGKKYMLTQTRHAYSMLKAFQMTGDTTYLPYAERTLNFMYETMWDSVNTGWIHRNNNKQSFEQHYALLGVRAAWELTRDSLHYTMLMDGFEALDTHLWDNREDYLGYYDAADYDWSNPTGKGFGATVDAITTHALQLYLLTGEERFRNRLTELGDIIVDRLITTMDDRYYGFDESYDSDWNVVNWDSFYFTGHILKTAWCLSRIYQVNPKDEYLEGARKILDDVTNIRLQGLYDDNISQWWEYEQAYTSGIMTYYLTGDETYLEFADVYLENFIATHWDSEHYEFFTAPDNTSYKGDYYKTSYHSVELAYFMYLYGNLYLHNKPVSLYYRIEPMSNPREISLYPLAIRDDFLEISAVELNDDTFTSFDAGNRILSVPENTGGIFKVTFSPVGQPTNTEFSSNSPQTFNLAQNYPNPFNPTTRISYQLRTSSDVQLEVFDAMGRKVAELVNGLKASGNHSLTFDASQFSSGLYLYRLQVNGQVETKKMLLIK